MKYLMLSIAMITATVPARAHVVMSETEAKAGAYYFGFLRVGHGCDGLATERVTVEIPEGIYSAKPQPKPGWNVEIVRERLAEPAEGPHGKMVEERVVRIIWSGGSLPDDMVDQFGLSLKLPEQSGPLYLPTVQSCDGGEKRWTMMPPTGAAWGSVPAPAPVINLEAGGHAHH